MDLDYKGFEKVMWEMMGVISDARKLKLVKIGDDLYINPLEVEGVGIDDSGVVQIALKGLTQANHRTAESKLSLEETIKLLTE